MPPVERIRPTVLLAIFNFIFIGCLNPERAGQDRFPSSTGINSRARSAEVVQAAANDTPSSGLTGRVTQALGRDRVQGSSPPSYPTNQGAGSPAPIPSNYTETRAMQSPSAGPTDTSPSPIGTSSPGSHSLASGATAPNSAIKLRELYNQAALRFATIDSYVARLRRREFFKGKDQPEELILFKFRKQPWSVYFKWLGAEGQGREVLYVKGQHGNMIHSLLAAGDMPFAPAGKHMALSPDNIFVRSASRHSITEAGIGVIIEKLGVILESQERGEKKLGPLAYQGQRKRPEFESPLDVVEHTLPPGLEPQLPSGGRRWTFFDPVSHLPVLMITHDEKGHEVEYYCYDRIQFPVKLDDLDFDPDRLWPAKKP